jgi:hypothetical protein
MKERDRAGPLRNVGPVSRRWLAEVGVVHRRDLERAGIVATFRMVRDLHPREVSWNLLWALEGALCDCDWRAVSEERKRELRAQVGGTPRPR